MFFLLLLLSTAVVVFFTGWYFQQKWHFRSIRHIPSASNYPVVGSVLELGMNPVESLKNFVRLLDTNGPLCRISLGQRDHYIFVSDPDLTEFFLSSPKFIKKSSGYNLMKEWLGEGLLTSNGSKWHKRRKVITPAFHFKILEQFLPIFEVQENILINKLYKQIDKEAFDIYPFITAYTLDTICETAMGTNVNAQIKEDNAYVMAVKNISSIFINRTFSAWKQFDFLFPLANEYKDYTKSLNIIHNFTDSVIKKRRNELLTNYSKETEIKEAQTDDVGMKKKQVFLDLLLQSTIEGRLLADSDIREEVDTFMFEGHDTVASAICFTLYGLRKNQNNQRKVIDEIDEIFGDDKTREPTFQDLCNMKYLEATIKESLRLYPPVPYIGRQLERDVTYKGVTYPKSLHLMFFIFYMHRRKDLFKDALTFNPGRYLTDTTENQNPFTYIPFSAGPRNCIGQKFAMIELKAVLSKFFRHFELPDVSSSHDVILSGETILKSANGIWIRLKKRQN